ncbi:hypothetical protein [Lactococcus lactis]|uniref:hypothetical protein n=2 Tax=Lactococcus lactis TaxID=1358 RepID=UPI000559A41D|nr:hypothetical protein [Lactococcus lactis]AJA57761.1 hypothetical protein QI18_10400 [Lactococcus lactis subsp. lactis]WBM77116.1 hypothetical protein OHI04_10095 [Lactococcus lactis]WSP31579.1 hypothetical protein VVB72_10080 [Lactococcus lactis subsp. lactis]
MSELEKAKQEVEQVCFAYDKAGDTGDIKDWKEYYDLENKLIDKVKISNQPQLTIPKSIADELDKYDFELTSKGLMYRNMGGTLLEFSRVTYDEIPQLIVQTIAGNYRIVFAYLAGKALGVDLVKVGEGLNE